MVFSIRASIPAAGWTHTSHRVHMIAYRLVGLICSDPTAHTLQSWPLLCSLCIVINYTADNVTLPDSLCVNLPPIAPVPQSPLLLRNMILYTMDSNGACYCIFPRRIQARRAELSGMECPSQASSLEMVSARFSISCPYLSKFLRCNLLHVRVERCAHDLQVRRH